MTRIYDEHKERLEEMIDRSDEGEEETEYKALWAYFRSLVDEDTCDKVWHLAVTQGSDAVVDYLDLHVKDPKVRRAWIMSKLNTIYDYSLRHNPFRV